MKKVIKTEDEWKALLSRDEYRVLRQSHTEKPFSGKFNDFSEPGLYVCAACGNFLFASSTKYDHGTGWPSFTAPVDEERLETRPDGSFGMLRTEVRCAACGSHLGHVFDDGPPPEGRHFCINSTALRFRPEAEDRDRALETATFAAGCFWGVEDKFRNVRGVVRTRVGYAGGHAENPAYETVCGGETGHAEAVEVVFDPAVVSYADLLELFFMFHDPTQVDRQGPDIGRQYRSAIFAHDESQRRAALEMIARLDRSGRFRRPIATRVEAAPPFYEAEPYHQQYHEKIRKVL